MASSTDRQQRLIGAGLATLTVFLGSILAATGKHLSGQVHISTIVLAQYGICFLCTLPWLLRNGRHGLRTTRPWQHILRGVSGCACFYTYYMALKYIPLVDASLLRNTAPLMVPLVVLIGFGTRIPSHRWPPLIIGFLGITLVLRPSFAGISIWHVMGLASALGLAISMVSTRLLAESEPESRILFYYFTISLLFVLPFFASTYQPIPASSLPWLAILGVGMYFTFVLYTRAYTYASASTLAPTSYFSIVFSGLIDWIIWDHVPDALTFAGIVLVVLGGMLVLRGRDEGDRPAATPSET